MSGERIWAMLLHMTATMWPKGDPDSRDSQNAKDPQSVYDNCERPSFQADKLEQILRFMPQCGFNTVMLDVGNGMEYERHPDISMKHALTKDEMKRLCDFIRSLGMEPVPKLNFSCGHNPWLRKYSRMVGTEEYYEVTRDCIDEVVEVFGSPKYFHLGLDEEKSTMLGGYGFRNLRCSHIWWRDAHRLFDHCAHHNARPWVWSDVAWSHPEEFKANMPKSVLQSNWYYNMDPGKDEQGKFKNHMCLAYQLIDELGYDQVPTCSIWQNETNSDFTFRMCREDLKDSLVKGVLAAPWLDAKDEQIWMLMQEAEQFRVAKAKYYPEG